jgi:glycosyltransferase involved in cell wall biosynthesis
MRVLIFHGYLLAGTGSNVYNARLAEALGRLGHEVHLFCQDRHPRRQPFVEAAGDWDSGELRVSVLGAQGEDGSKADGSPLCTTYRPDIGGLLPVYVLDPYEGIEAKTFAQCSEAEVAAYIRANVDAVREVTKLVRPDVALANHLVMGPVILARALGGRTPYAVKIHGSALEYTVKPQPERFLPFAREGLAQARTVLVGSGHTAESLWAALGAECGAQVKRRTRLGPPGVDVERFVPRELRDMEAGETVAFVGKLIAAKGIDLLVAAWPLVLQRRPNARLLVVGFGSWREQVEDLCRALGQRELGRAEDIALPYLLAFLRGLSAGERERYADAARRLADRIVFAGRLDHDELADVLPACEALVVPSTFPEAFGMVAVEAAACGVLPISAGHSGLAEVSAVIAGELPSEAAAWLSFPVDDNAVRAIAERVLQWLQADAALKERTRAALVAVARERWSWEGVGRGVIAAARAEPDRLERDSDASAR